VKRRIRSRNRQLAELAYNILPVSGGALRHEKPKEFSRLRWFDGHAEEDEMAKRFETTVRCIPFADQMPPEAQGTGACILTGQPSQQRVIMARAY